MSNNSEPLRITAIPDGHGGIVLALYGELDIASAARLREEMRVAVRTAPERLLLDLSGLRFMDGAGLRIIVEAIELMGDRLLLTPGPPQVQRLFMLAGIADAISLDARMRPKPVPYGPNVMYVRQLWNAFSSGGGAAVAELAPPESEWQPWEAGGKVLRGPDELRDYWVHRATFPTLTPTRFLPLGSDVLVRLVGQHERSERVVWALFKFDHGSLRRALTFERRSDALRHADSTTLGSYAS